MRHAQIDKNTRKKVYDTCVERGHWIAKEDKDLFEVYESTVERLTARNYYDYFYVINPFRLERGKTKYTLDHIFSIKKGFEKGILPSVISHPCNLRLIWYSENSKKNCKCGFSFEELKRKIRS